MTTIGSKVHKEHLIHLFKFLSHSCKQIGTQFFRSVTDRGKYNKPFSNKFSVLYIIKYMLQTKYRINLKERIREGIGASVWRGF